MEEITRAHRHTPHHNLFFSVAIILTLLFVVLLIAIFTIPNALPGNTTQHADPTPYIEPTNVPGS